MQQLVIILGILSLAMGLGACSSNQQATSSNTDELLVGKWEVVQVSSTKDLKGRYQQGFKLLEKQLLEHSLFIFNADSTYRFLINGQLVQGLWMRQGRKLLLRDEQDQQSEFELLQVKEDQLIVALTVPIASDSSIRIQQKMKHSDKEAIDLMTEAAERKRLLQQHCPAAQPPPNARPFAGLSSTYFDREVALGCAQHQKKPLLVVHSQQDCASCEAQDRFFQSDPRLLKFIVQNYVICKQYKDEQTLQQQFPNQKAPLFTIHHPKNKQSDTLAYTLNELEIKRFLVDGLD